MRVFVRSVLLCGSSLIAAMASVSLAQADMTPATPAPVYTFPQAPNGYFGTNGGAGNDADCTQSSIGEGKPNDGGAGGSPAAYTQTVTTSVSSPTYGTGIIVLSTGGNGGEGGSGSWCYGGRGGGQGGAGGNITLTNGSGSGNAPTLSVSGTGFLANSQGGVGGTGGGTSNSTGAGNGGYGGNGGVIWLQNNATLSTTSTNAFGLYGLSMGGNGGKGGSNGNGTYGPGGSGAYGGLGGQVTIVNYGTISTQTAYAMLGISVGGYGGNSGSASGFVPSPNGASGGGGPGGNVTIQNYGQVSTNGNGQTAMVALSVGGGGGDAGRASSLVALGNTGGQGANGGVLSMSNSGTVQTMQMQSIGLAAIGVGGGGGTGGMASSSLIGGGGSGGGGGKGGTITVSNTGAICTGGGCSTTAGVSSGGVAPAIAALSVGGGGGMGGYAITGSTNSTVAIGGAGGNGGDGGQVLATNTGQLRTTEIASPGLFAASVGGGGGNGGGTFSISGSSNSTLSMAVGGSGGSGGDAGTVGVNCGQSGANSTGSTACHGGTLSAPASTSGIVTFAAHAPGVVGVSIGGGGGWGGMGVSLAGSSSLAVSISVGGSGGSGGNGNAVYVGSGGVNTTTYGDMANGLVAMSIGGGGGHGGKTFYMPDYIPGGATAGAAGSVTVGGSGGNGGKGNIVLVENVGSIVTTNGDRASGIFAASIGGRGGHGGFSGGGTAGLALALSTSVGGNGGSGNTAGSVTVNNLSVTGGAANIITSGADSHGIEALSIGGGGGSGGWSAGAGASIGASSSIAVGGTGGSGGNGGAVGVFNNGLIQIGGRGGAGVLALSVAGGGGNGGTSASSNVSLTGAFSNAVGGVGNGGGTGGAVTILNYGTIAAGTSTYTAPTDPARATQGILAISVGGGGGRGGIAIGGDVTATSTSSSLTDTVGGGSGNGGTGGAVTVTNYGVVKSFGDMSTAVTGMSVGGRGGLGGIAIGGGVSTGTPMAMTLGSNGGNGGTGGTVEVENAGMITSGGFTVPGSNLIVGGFRAIGLVAQSIGGHGGMGGISIGMTIDTPQSTAASLSLGGSGGGGGTGGKATAKNDSGASISTNGPFSAGMVAQSLGGNGGIGGLGGGVSTTLISPSMTLGGNGGNGADGGAATATNAGTVTTQGLHSLGILAQSIGGNGGMSGATLAVGSADRAAQVGMTLGNAAGTGGDGGTASTTNTGTVTTTGMLSTGISAESIGGGGGRAGVAMDIAAANLANTTGSTSSIALGSQGGAGGDGGVVTLTHTGVVTTGGYQSDALYAGSVGGGGGSGGVSYINMTLGSKTMNLSAGGVNGAAGDGGTVTVNANQNQSATASYGITSIGPFSHGVFAQSVGGGGGSATALHGVTTIGGLVQGLMNLGGMGSATGDGDTVNVNTGGQIYTGGTSTIPGTGAIGILAQSIGGGGGVTLSGLLSATVTASIPDTPITITAGLGSASNSNGSSGSSTSGPSTTLSLTSATSTTVGAASSMSVGGFSPNRGNAGAVNVTSTSTIVTAGMMSDAIKAQSIGGGGGFSGFSDINSGSPFAATTMTLGGGGNGGGYGGNVTVNSSGTIYTEGGLSLGILAQSLGSGGGDLRHVSMGPVRTAFAANLGIKATAYGGDGGYVTVNNTAYIATYGIGADGLVAQSVGGGGGMSGLYGQSANAPSFAPNATASSGGAEAGIAYPVTGSNQAYSGIVNGSVNGGAAVSTATGISMAAIMGAAGGTGASANDVNVTSNAYIATGKVPSVGPGDGSIGIIAQAIGGGGGVTRQHTINFDQSQISMGLTMGTVNNANGNGDTVNVTNNTASWASNASITTAGQGSMGLLAQSIGGGGGLGMLTAGTSGAGGSASIAMVLGAEGTASGYGNPVTIISGGIITTTGSQAQAIVAQSIGSGGGVGKAAIYSKTAGTQWSTAQGSAYADSTRTYAYANSGMDAGIRLGANATGGSNSDNVSVTTNSTITTSGIRSTGIVAQSIAGGGGLVDITADALNGGNLNAQVILGGNSTSNPGTVGVATSGVIQTTGALADGILAQSITAGGGSFGLSHTGVTASGTGNVQFIMGSDYQNNNTGAGNVTINSQQWISTTGFGSTGITAQSIGSGGGLLAYLTTSQTTGLNATGTMGSANGSGNGGDGGTVSVTTSGSTNTYGDFAHAIVAQSIGAGGGRIVGTAAGTNITLGSKGYSGDGSSVTVTNNSTVLTNGSYSHGIVAQSIGAGGGLIDIKGTSVAFGSPTSWGSSDPTGVNVNAAIVTNGVGSMGVIAQSIAGGGGLAVASGTISLGASKNAGQYNGDTVTVNVGGSITTYGNSSPAVVAYSGGGGGGVAFVPSVSSVPLVYNKGNGNASDATINVNQNIVTKGNYSHGAIAASLAGGGGLLIGSDGYVALQGQGSGSAGTVQINVKSGYSILTYGTGSTATWGIASKGKSDPEINIETGATVMGGPGGYGVLINGEVNNVNNYGTLGTFDGVSGMAIKTDPGVTTINNGGRLTGSVQLGAGQNVFNNLAGGVVVAGSVLDLSSTGVFNNAGVLQAGGGVVGNTTVVTGAFNQSQGGLIQAAVGPGGQSSHLVVNGNASLAGQLGVVFADNVVITPGAFANASVVTVNGTLTNAGLSANSTAMVQNALAFNGNSIGLQGNVTFTPMGLSAEGVRFGQALALYQANGSSPVMNAIVHDLVQVPNVGTLERNYSDIAGGSVSAVVQTGLQTAQGGMMSFAEQADRWRAGPSRPEDKLWQMWIAPFAAYSNVGAASGGMNANFFGASAGVDMQVMGDTLIGIGVAGSQNRVDVATSSLNANQGAGGAGLYALQRFGKAYLSASSYIGMDHTQVNRRFMNAGSANASFDATLAGFRLEAGYTMPFQGFTLTPFAAFAPVWRWQNGTTETAYYNGLAGAGLVFASQTSSSLPLILGLQLDRNMTLSDGSVISAFLRAGWVHEFNTNRALTKNLPGLAAASFTTGGDYAFPNAALIRLGAQYKLTEQMSFFADVNSLLATQGVTLGGQIGMQVKW